MAFPALPLGLAAASAATFGLSTSLQHRVTSGVEPMGPHQLMGALLRRPAWLLGMMLSVVAFALHAAALSSGALVVVQPVIVTGVVFAVLIRALLDRQSPTRAEVGWAAVTWAGLASFLLGTGAPRVASDVPAHAGVIVSAFAGLAGAAALAAHRQKTGSVRKGLWLGVVSGILFGLVAVLLKLTLLTVAGTGLTATVASWVPWIMVACGVCAVVVNQQAYQAARLSVSMPILNIIDVLVALVFAAAVFGERPVFGPTSLLAEVAGLVGMSVGVTQLARLAEPSAGAVPAPELVPSRP